MNNLLEQLNIKTNNIDIYKEPFTHSSYANEHNLNYNYERLEFLGDAIVDFIVGEYIYKNYHYAEGEMTKFRSTYVCENALYEYSKSIKLDQYILIGKGENNLNKAIIADVFESFIGCVYLDCGFEKAKEVVLKIIIPFIDSSDNLFSDYKSKLQELVQTNKKTVIYEVINESGPAHDKMFKVVVKIDNINYGEGVGTSKKRAEQNAAREALNKQVK